MKHFIGGASVGVVFALMFLPTKKAGAGDNMYLFAHALIITLFGLSAWGLLP